MSPVTLLLHKNEILHLIIIMYEIIILKNKYKLQCKIKNTLIKLP